MVSLGDAPLAFAASAPLHSCRRRLLSLRSPRAHALDDMILWGMYS